MSEHEHRDISLRLIVWSAITFLVAGVIIHVGVWWLFKLYRAQDEQRDVRRTRVEEPSPVPPEPRLQITPQADLTEYLRSQRQTLRPSAPIRVIRVIRGLSPFFAPHFGLEEGIWH